MIYQNDKMLYYNVFSKRCITSFDKIQVKMKEFFVELKTSDIVPVGECFYCFKKIGSIDEIEFEVFQPVKEYKKLNDDEIIFRTYFYQDNMISTIVLDDFQNIEWNYAELMLWMEEKKEIALSNIYNEIHKHQDGRYIIVKVATAKIKESIQ